MDNLLFDVTLIHAGEKMAEELNQDERNKYYQKVKFFIDILGDEIKKDSTSTLFPLYQDAKQSLERLRW